MRNKTWTCACAAATVLAFTAIAGCVEKGALERAGEGIDRAVDDVGDAVGEAVDRTGDALDELTLDET